MKYTYLLALLLLMGCKTEKENNSKDSSTEVTESPTQKVKDNILKIELDFQANEDDIFELYYTDLDEEEAFSGNKKFRKKIKGGDASQKLEFSFEKEVFPYKLRIDLGQNANTQQKEVVINEIVLKYNSNSIPISGDSLQHFFVFNKFIERNNESRVLKLIEINGKRDPFLIAKAVLIKKMEIEL